jgi:hypothetical protein
MVARLPGWLILLGALALTARLPAGRAQQPAVDKEYLLKAGYLSNFLRYTVWPQAGAPGGQFVIGVLGKNPFGAVKAEIEKLEIDKKKVVVREFKSMKDYQACHILFVSNAPAGDNPKEQAADRLASALATLNKQPVLVVADSPGLAAKGAMLNLYLEMNNVKYEINVEAIKGAGLAPKADLQKYGKAVTSEKK